MTTNTIINNITDDTYAAGSLMMRLQDRNRVITSKLWLVINYILATN